MYSINLRQATCICIVCLKGQSKGQVSSLSSFCLHTRFIKKQMLGNCIFLYWMSILFTASHANSFIISDSVAFMILLSTHTPYYQNRKMFSYKKIIETEAQKNLKAQRSEWNYIIYSKFLIKQMPCSIAQLGVGEEYW